MWYWKNKILFVHCTKTGGESIERHLRKCCGYNPVGLFSRKRSFAKHAHAPSIKRYVGAKAWNSYFKFSIVRNPWDKMVSQYFYNGQTRSKNFKDYIRKFGIEPRRYRGTKASMASPLKNFGYAGNKPISKLLCHNPRHLPYLTDSSGKIIIDFVGRFENYSRDVNYALNKAGLPRLNNSWENVSDWEKPASARKNRAPYWEYYDDETRDIVAKQFKTDIDYFGYEFGK